MEPPNERLLLLLSLVVYPFVKRGYKFNDNKKFT